MNPFEPNEERFDNAQERDHWEECNRKAWEYLSTYPKPSCYFAKECEGKVEFIPYTDGEVWKIKKIVLKLWNASAETPAASFNALKISDYSALKGKNKDLDALIWDRAHAYEIEPNFLNLYNPAHLYQFSLLTSEGEQRIKRVELNDQEYRYLLTEQLYDPEFNFDKLSLYNPELANWFREIKGDATSIRFDELIDDARAIIEYKPMTEPLKITSLQQFLEIVFASRKSHHFFIQLNGARSWKTISREDFDYDKDGDYKLYIRNEIDDTAQIITKDGLKRCTNIVQAITDGNFYQLDME